MGTADQAVDGYYLGYESADGTLTGSFAGNGNCTEITFPVPGIYTVYLAGITGYNSNDQAPAPYTPALLEVRNGGSRFGRAITVLFGIALI